MFLYVYRYVHVSAGVPRRPEESVRSPELELHRGGCELPVVGVGPLEEQQVFLTFEPSLQLQAGRAVLLILERGCDWSFSLACQPFRKMRY